MDNYTVLCVDDEICILSLLKRLLRKEPYEVLLINNGEEALEILKNREIALIISDYKMPGISGLDLVRQARKISPRTKSILISGFVPNSTNLRLDLPAKMAGLSNKLKKELLIMLDIRWGADRKSTAFCIGGVSKIIISYSPSW